MPDLLVRPGEVTLFLGGLGGNHQFPAGGNGRPLGQDVDLIPLVADDVPAAHVCRFPAGVAQGNAVILIIHVRDGHAAVFVRQVAVAHQVGAHLALVDGHQHAGSRILGLVYLHVGIVQDRQHPRGRGVRLCVRIGGNHSDSRLHGADQIRRGGVRFAVVGDLDDVARRDAAGLEQLLLLGEFHVAGQEHASAAALRHQHQGVAVLHVGSLHRPDHRQLARPQGQHIARPQEGNLLAPEIRGFHQRMLGGLAGKMHGGVPGAHLDGGGRQGQHAARVVLVGVSQDDAGELFHLQQRQCPGDVAPVLLQTHVDQVGVAAAVEQQCIALTHIDGKEGQGAVRLGVGGFSPRGGADQQRQQAQENRQHTFHSFSPRYSIHKTYYE